METSEKLCEQLRDLEDERKKLEKAREKMVSDPETQALVLKLMTVERALDPNCPWRQELQKKIEAKGRPIREEEAGLNVKEKQIRKNLMSLTNPEIEKGREILSRELASLKLQRKVLGQQASGFDMKLKIEIESNEDALAQIAKLVREGISELQGMQFSPVPKIQEFLRQRLAEIRRIDIVPVRKVVDGLDNERREWLSAVR